MTEYKDCTCRLEEMITKECVICKKDGLTQSNPFDKHWPCRHHRSKAISICGYGEYVCSPCREEGWYSTAGTGGGTHHINKKTMQEKLKNGDIINVSCIY